MMVDPLAPYSLGHIKKVHCKVSVDLFIFSGGSGGIKVDSSIR
jgi:hypothetical protein